MSLDPLPFLPKLPIDRRLVAVLGLSFVADRRPTSLFEMTESDSFESPDEELSVGAWRVNSGLTILLLLCAPLELDTDSENDSRLDPGDFKLLLFEKTLGRLGNDLIRSRNLLSLIGPVYSELVDPTKKKKRFSLEIVF